MFKKNAIVLKSISHHKLALLDAELGRIDAVIRKPPLVGSLIEYTIERERGHLSFLGECSIVDLPFFLARSDILFWHHILELCYYFVPAGSHTPQLFELLSILYTVDKGSSWGIHAKKLFLFKLLATIGMQPEVPHIPSGKMHRYMAVPLNHLSNEALDEESEKLIDEWLRVCVCQHPAIEQFKTVHFLVGE